MSTVSSINNTLTQMQSDTNQVNFQRGQQNLGSNTLDKADFMQLLLAQLQYQDPMNPVDTNSFLNQQTQLAQMDSMNQLTQAVQNSSLMSQASSLVGKTVDVKDSNGNIVTGQIPSISISNGTAGFSINGTTYTLDQISKIYSN